MADIQTLVSNIPDAQDGTVITSDYHNSIKTALTAIVTQLGSGAGTQTVTQQVPVAFQPIAGAKPWGVTFASAADAGPPSTNGWIPLNLPDGAVIQQLLVTAARTNTGASGFVTLVIVPINMTSGTILILVDLSTAGSSPATLPPGVPNVPGLTTVALKDLQTVQNAQFKYLLQAEVFSTAGVPAAAITIYGLQVVYKV